MNLDIAHAMTVDAPADRDTETEPTARQLAQVAYCVPTRVWLRVSEQVGRLVVSTRMTKTLCARPFELVVDVAEDTERQ